MRLVAEVAAPQRSEFGAEAVDEPAGGREHQGQGQQVAAGDPLDLGQGGVELAAEGRERDIYDRGVEIGHQRAEEHHDGDGPDAAIEGWRGI
jgi:hypothetical protein